MAHPIAFERLDLDHVGPKVAENLGRKGTLGKLAKICDSQSFERSWHLGRVTPEANFEKRSTVEQW
jgi:hypothetical protein